MVCYIIKANQVRGVAQVVAHQTGGLGVASSSLVTPTKKSRILIGILLFLCNQQDLNLRTSFQTASRYGAAVWEKPPAAYSNALLHLQ